MCVHVYTNIKNPYLKSQTSSDTIVNVFKILLFKKYFKVFLKCIKKELIYKRVCYKLTYATSY